MKKNPKIQYGNIEIPDEDLHPRNVKFRVTMFLDLDLLDEIRKLAAAKKLPYQTFINKTLREAIFGYDDDARIRKVVREELKKHRKKAKVG